jgi:hypothetical protein
LDVVALDIGPALDHGVVAVFGVALQIIPRDLSGGLDLAGGLRHRWIFVVALGLTLIGLGSVLLQRGFGGSTAPIMPSVTSAAHIVQDHQRAETKRLSEQIAILNEKLDAIQQSIAAARMPSSREPSPSSAAKSS